MELCRYIVLNPIRVKGHLKTGAWKWSSYRATAGLAPAPGLLRADWVLGQFGKNRTQAQKQYREFVKEGLESRPWERLTGEIYLGSQKFIEQHSPRHHKLKEIPRAQLKAARPSLERIFAKNAKQPIVQVLQRAWLSAPRNCGSSRRSLRHGQPKA